MMIWYLLYLLAGRCSWSSSSGLDGACLETVLPAGALPFLRAGESGVGRSAMAELAGVGAGDRIGTSAGTAGLDGVGPMGWRWSLGECQSKMSFSSLDEKWTSSVLPTLLEGLADGMGWVAAERDAVGVASGWVLKKGDCLFRLGRGGDGGVIGVEPKGESGVASQLAGMAAGVVVGLLVEVWLETGTIGGEAGGDGCASAGADGPTSSWAAASPCFSVVYLSPGLVGTAALLQSAEMRQGKACIPLSFLQAAASSWAMNSPTLKQ
ncbi:hypothetical protein V6N12_076231 [Hibiscus sabdariffa]|uniref:Secreted protein n=1 Tax=Hibiscus sabdariffa TaxID=183260 RepID=A0ABR2AZF6_9ROSI